MRVRVRQNHRIMAQKTVALLEDDLDGGPADETVTFGLDGVTYEIDLTADNAARLREVFGPYAGAGRRVGRRAPLPRAAPAGSRSRGSGPARTDPAQLAAIRAWARARGMQVSDRAGSRRTSSSSTTTPLPSPRTRWPGRRPR